MARVRSCDIPEELYYLIDKHVWVRPEGDTVVVGLTDVAQNLARTVISVSLKGTGKPIRTGRSLATVESGKWVGPVPSPVDGEIVETNQALVADPSTINRDPYGAGWVARIRTADWASASVELATGPEGVQRYAEYLESEGISCGEP